MTQATPSLVTLSRVLLTLLATGLGGAGGVLVAFPITLLVFAFVPFGFNGGIVIAAVWMLIGSALAAICGLWAGIEAWQAGAR